MALNWDYLLDMFSSTFYQKSEEEERHTYSIEGVEPENIHLDDKGRRYTVNERVYVDELGREPERIRAHRSHVRLSTMHVSPQDMYLDDKGRRYIANQRIYVDEIPPKIPYRSRYQNGHVPWKNVQLDSHNGRRYVEMYTRQQFQMKLNGEPLKVSLFTGDAFIYRTDDGFYNVSRSWDYKKCSPETIRSLLNVKSLTDLQEQKIASCQKTSRRYETSFCLRLPEFILWEPNSIFTVGMTRENRFPLAGQVRMNTSNVFKGRPFYMEPCAREVLLDTGFGWGTL